MKNRNLHTEFKFITSRSGGSGGQHVNKVNTKVELRFDVVNSQILSDEEKTLILTNLQNRITSEGILQIVSQKTRSQSANKEDSINKFYEIIEKALVVKKKRKRLKPSKKYHRKRLDEKKRTSDKKQDRKKIF